MIVNLDYHHHKLVISIVKSIYDTAQMQLDVCMVGKLVVQKSTKQPQFGIFVYKWFIQR